MPPSSRTVEIFGVLQLPDHRINIIKILPLPTTRTDVFFGGRANFLPVAAPTNEPHSSSPLPCPPVDLNQQDRGFQSTAATTRASQSGHTFAIPCNCREIVSGEGKLVLLSVCITRCAVGVRLVCVLPWGSIRMINQPRSANTLPQVTPQEYLLLR